MGAGSGALACQCTDAERLRRELEEARLQVVQLTQIAKDQARAIAELTEECPPWAPSVAILYWLYAPTREADPNYRHLWARLVPTVNALGDLPAMKLTPLVWDTHRASRRKTALGRYGEPIKEATLNMELVRIKEMLGWAVRNKFLKYNPISAARPVKTVNNRETWLVPDQVERLLAAADDVTDKRSDEGNDDGFRSKVLRAFTLACHDSMLRYNEARNLRRDRIRADGRVELAGAETKGRKRRTIFLTPRTLEAIAALPVHGPYVFADADGQLHERRIRRWFRRCCVVAGVDVYAAPGEMQIRPHDLRASGATTADEHGARAKAIQDAMGHSQFSTTAPYLRSEKSSNARTVATVIISATEPRRGAKRAMPRPPVIRVNVQT